MELGRHICFIFKRIGLMLVLAAVCLPAFAEQIKLESLKVGMRTYKNVTVLGFNATDVYFTHSKGISNARLKTLEPDMQKLFKYDEETASRAEQQQEIDNEEFNKQVVITVEENARAGAELKRRKEMTSEESLADPLSDKSPIGRALPDLKVERWLGTKPETQSRSQLIYLWAPWSLASKKFADEVNSLHGKFGNEVAFYGIVSEKTTDPEGDSGIHLNFPSGIEPTGKFVETLGVNSLPQAVLVDAKGVVRYLGNPGALTDKRLQGLITKFAQ